MNILLLTNHLNTGGITSYAYTLAKGLRARGHKVYIASSGGRKVEDFTRCGISFFRIPVETKNEFSLRVGLSFFALRRLIREKRIEVVHSNTRVTQVLGCLLKRAVKSTHISTCHGYFKNRFSRRIFPCWGDRVIAISDAVREHLIRDFQVRPERIRMIYNGIEAQPENPAGSAADAAARARLGIKAGPVVGIIARLSEVKGHAHLIRAMPKVLAQLPEAQLVIVGEGKIKPDLVGLCERLGISRSVYFISELPDLPEALAAMDVFVMPSLNEGLGLSLMEAMAAGRAVIGSNVGGIPNLIRHEDTGILVEPGNEGQISESVIRLLKDKNKRGELGLRAREFIVNNFSARAMVEQTERVYLKCLNA